MRSGTRLACRSSGMPSDAARDDPFRRGAGELGAVDLDRARRRPGHPAQDVDELGLPVPGYPGDAQDLAPADLERDPAERLEAVAPDGTQVPDGEDGRGSRVTVPARPGDSERRPADHHPRQFAVVGRARHRADQRPLAQDADPVADGAHLAELVADEDDAEASRDEPSERGEQGVDLLGHEDGGRLVEDEEPAIPSERLEDLDALLLPDGEMLDDRVSGRRRSRIARRRPPPGASPRLSSTRMPPRPRARFSATVIGLTSEKCWVTIPIPTAIASRGDRILTVRPSTLISPASGSVRP